MKKVSLLLSFMFFTLSAFSQNLCSELQVAEKKIKELTKNGYLVLEGNNHDMKLLFADASIISAALVYSHLIKNSSEALKTQKALAEKFRDISIKSSKNTQIAADKSFHLSQAAKYDRMLPMEKRLLQHIKASDIKSPRALGASTTKVISGLKSQSKKLTNRRVLSGARKVAGKFHTKFALAALAAFGTAKYYINSKPVIKHRLISMPQNFVLLDMAGKKEVCKKIKTDSELKKSFDELNSKLLVVSNGAKEIGSVYDALDNLEVDNSLRGSSKELKKSSPLKLFIHREINKEVDKEN